MRVLLLFFVALSLNVRAQETNTSIGFVVSPNFSSVRYSAPSSNTSWWNESKENTAGTVGLSGAVFFQYKLTERLFVLWRLGAQNYRYKRTFTSLDETDFTAKNAYSQYYLQFGTSVKYRIVKTLYVRAGVGADILLEARLKLSNSYSDGYYHKGNDGAKFKGAMVPISLATGYELKLSERVNAVVELNGTMVISDALNVTPNTNVLQRRPWQMGASIGVIRSF